MIRLLLGLICLLSVSILHAQLPDEEKKDIKKAKIGMSEKQLIKVAGEPERKERFKTIIQGSTDTTCYWLYENDITVILRNHYIDRIERDRNAILLKVQEWADPKNKDGINLIYGK
ncbi:MAG: hypothetical protein ACK445_05685 [Bacteroidota bacterium]|jgi:hypothetical protein|nr:hypothetical protein [Sphingobacteriales bacterium]